MNPAAVDRALLSALLAAEAMDTLARAAQAKGELGLYLAADPARAIVATAAAAGLNPGDWLFPGFDGLGGAILRGLPLARIAARILGSTDDPAQGRALPGFLWSKEHRIAPPSIQQAALLAQAVGVALDDCRRGGGGVVLACAGELACASGALEGPLHLARARALPLVVVLVGKISATKADCVVAGCALAVRDAVAHAAARARAGEGPSVIAVDPAGPGMERLVRLFDDRTVADLRARAQDDAASAFALARAAGRARDPEPLDHVTVLEGAVRAAQRARRDGDANVSRPVAPGYVASSTPAGHQEWTMARAIKEALADALCADDAVALLGEEVDRGGIYGVTAGLSDPYHLRLHEIAGDDALRVGAAIGMALAGARPVAEVLLSDHLLPALPQIVGELANLRYFTYCELVAPVVLRVPVARGTAAGPRQSLAPERFLAGIPGLVVACPSCPQDAYGIVRAALAGTDPVVILEPAVLYATRGSVDTSVGFELGRARRIATGTDLVIVAWGAAVAVALEAARGAEDEGLSLGVLDLVTLAPLDAGAILEAVAETGRAIVCGDEPRTGGLGAEVVALIAEGALEYLRAPVLRLCGLDAPLPTTGEAAVRGLDAAALLAASRDLIAWR